MIYPSHKMIRFTLKGDSEEFFVDYILNQNSFTERWLSHLKDHLGGGSVIENAGHFYGKVFHDESLLEKELNELILELNDYCWETKQYKFLIPMKASLPMKQDFLSKLHTHFEKMTESPIFKRTVKIHESLSLLNIKIHHAEHFVPEDFETFDRVSVQVIFSPSETKFFEPEDYQHFKLDYDFGDLFMVYGITGVPTREAFYQKSVARPQDCYSAGMMLCFFRHKFEAYNELSDWLISQGLNPHDPKLALGYVHLGRMTSPNLINEEAFLQKLKKNQKVVRCQIFEGV